MDVGIVEAEVKTLGVVGTLVTLGGTVLRFLVGAVLIRVEVKTIGGIGTLVNNMLIFKSLNHPECSTHQ